MVFEDASLPDDASRGTVGSVPPTSSSSADVAPSTARVSGVGSDPHLPTYSQSPEHGTNHFLLPVPSPPKRSRSSFAISGPVVEDAVLGFELDLAPEVATADISIAPDGSFVETSSGAAAREIKRRYDQSFGVGKDVRSPYAITAFVNQHGKQVYRVGHRELSAPGASAEDAEHRASRRYTTSQAPLQSPPQSYQTQMRRRSRMSVHSFLTPSVFKNGPPPSTGATPTDGSRSPPVRKLRKTRSIPNLLDTSTPQSSPQIPPLGRPHAHSVSSADAFRISSSIADTPSRAPNHDIFADVMSWHSMPSSPLASTSTSHSTHSLDLPPSASSQTSASHLALRCMSQPFGPGVAFDSPAWAPGAQSLASPPVLREMQSFESGLTARADYQTKPSYVSNLQPPLIEVEVSATEDPWPLTTPPTPAVPRAKPLDETIMHSRYSTDVFDVLQTSRGLPSLDRITETPTERTIKLSLKADDSVAPRDDPRFVIWGEVEPVDLDERMPSSITDLSSAKSGASRRRAGKESGGAPAPDPPPYVSISSEDGPKRMIVAATIERWIAQLTSELDYDELLVFFLTYRSYVSATDLGHLLICRFHWALSEPNSPRDETVRRIVRVRTFTAIRYWVLTFFNVDFVPNRELRLLFADWLNTLRRDPVLQRHKDALKIVRQLRKVILDCRDAYLRKGKSGAGESREKSDLSVPKAPAFTTPLRENPVQMGGVEPEDPDIDLDFDGGEAGQSFGGNPVASIGGATQAVDLVMLRQPLNLAFLQYGKQNAVSLSQSAVPHPVLLPVPHNTLSRVFVNTIGRLGRWKRVLNTRSPTHPPLNTCVDVSAFDVEANETGDLYMLRGGVEQYLRMFEISQANSAARSDSMTLSGEPAGRDSISTIGFSYDRSIALGVHDDDAVQIPSGSASDSNLVRTSYVTDTPEPLSQRASVASTATYSAESLRTPVTAKHASSSSHVGYDQMDIVSIDELDLSDLSSEEDLQPAAPPGLKKLQRKLPTRRDFEFVRHSLDSVSSMGIHTRQSLMSTGSTASSTGPDLGGGPIQQWQMNALVDSLSDEEESGDVDAALRRLEGQISQDKQRAKQSKVDRWVQSIQQRQATGQRSYDSSDEEDYGEVDDSPQRGHTTVPSLASTSRTSLRSSEGSVADPSASATWDSSTPSTKHGTLVAPPTSETATSDKPVAKEDAVPLEIKESRITPGDAHVVDPHATLLPLQAIPPTVASAFVNSLDFKWHHSFIMSFRTATLIEHFSMIDRELFLNIRFEELVSSHSLEMDEEANILDWAQFLRDRARLKAEGRSGYKTSSLTVVRGRFNLMSNFVLSEVVLTHPSERVSIFCKLLRMAWKAYSVGNFNTLVAIMAGLTSHWVAKAMLQAPSRVGVSEGRMLKDLADWVTKEADFKHIRQSIDALSEAKAGPVGSQDASGTSTDGQSSATRSRAASESKPPSLPSCVPFIGVYLSQLRRYGRLPELVDPTAPDEHVGIDPATNIFEAPSHPEVFATLAPLPSTIQLEPLVNVHKQRLIAGVVKSLVAGQHLASRVQYPLDRKLFQKCLKLRGLDAETLERALSLYPDAK